MGSVQEFVRPQPFVGFLSMRLSMRLGLSMTGGLYRPVYWTFHRGSGSLSWPAGVGRPAESLDSGFGECPLGTRTSFRSPVPSDRSSSACQRVFPVETNRRNSSSNQEVTVVAGLSPKTFASQISNPQSSDHCALISAPSTNQDRELGLKQLTSRTLKPPPIGHFYEFLCRTVIPMAARSFG